MQMKMFLKGAAPDQRDWKFGEIIVDWDSVCNGWIGGQALTPISWGRGALLWQSSNYKLTLRKVQYSAEPPLWVPCQCDVSDFTKHFCGLWWTLHQNVDSVIWSSRSPSNMFELQRVPKKSMNNVKQRNKIKKSSQCFGSKVLLPLCLVQNWVA